MSSLGSVSINDLKRCGMQKARCIALLAGNAGQATASDRRMVDGAGVTLLACIEGELMESDLPSVPVFLELRQQESIRFLSRFFERDAITAAEDGGFNPNESFTYHPRFANGNLFTASVFGATVARSFNMPGIVELMEAIALGASNNQTSFPWQLYLPEGFNNKRYGEMVQSFLEAHNAVCLGLFRLCFPDVSDGNGPRFVVTNPDTATLLRDSDYLFVLGSTAFGKFCWDKGLLAGADDAPDADKPEEVEEVDMPAPIISNQCVEITGTLPLPPIEECPVIDGIQEAPLPRLRNQSLGVGVPGSELAVVPPAVLAQSPPPPNVFAVQPSPVDANAASQWT